MHVVPNAKMHTTQQFLWHVCTVPTLFWSYITQSVRRVGNAFTTQYIFIEHISHVYTIHNLEREDDVCSSAGMAAGGTWGASRQLYLKFTKKTDFFFSPRKKKKSAQHLYFSSTSHLMHDIKIVSLPLSFFNVIFIINKQGHIWS